MPRAARTCEARPEPAARTTGDGNRSPKRCRCTHSRWPSAAPPTSAAAVVSAAANLTRRARQGEAAYRGLRALIEAFYRAATWQAP